MSKIKPALTAEEWTLEAVDIDELDATIGKAPEELLIYSTVVYGRGRHAIAALALRDQPFGFTWGMVAAIRTVLFGVSDPSGWWGTMDDDERELAERLARVAADHIAALLPPEEDAND